MKWEFNIGDILVRKIAPYNSAACILIITRGYLFYEYISTDYSHLLPAICDFTNEETQPTYREYLTYETVQHIETTYRKIDNARWLIDGSKAIRSDSKHRFDRIKI